MEFYYRIKQTFEGNFRVQYKNKLIGWILGWQDEGVYSTKEQAEKRIKSMKYKEPTICSQPE
jgi:uncharacterized protein YegP (UPF0339 family)